MTPLLSLVLTLPCCRYKLRNVNVKISIPHACLLLRSKNNLETYSIYRHSACDVNEDTGVTVTDYLSVSERVREVTCRCVQSMHALRIGPLRCHGLSTESLQIVFKAVIVAKLTYASPAWWDLTTADDKNRMDCLLRRGVRVGLYEGPTVSQLVEDADDTFNSIYYIMNNISCISCCLNVIMQTIILDHGAYRTLSKNTDWRNLIHRLIFKDMF